MIRFVDLSQDYWTDPEENGGPVCAFLDTITNCFLESYGQHVIHDEEDLAGLGEYAERCAGLMPDGFFKS